MKKRKTLPLPDGFSERDIKLESSTCTGEKTIGFYSAAEKKLLFAELVRGTDDIIAFYERYGLTYDRTEHKISGK